MSLEFEKNVNSVPSIGLNMDDDPSNIREGEYTFALNAITTDNKQNEMYLSSHLGNKICTNLPSGYTIIGKIRLINDEYVLFLVNPTTNQSEIGILNNCIYTTSINDSCLNFNIQYPIKGVYKQVYNCGINIYWTDNYNPRRYMNLNSIPYKTINGVKSLDCDLIQINKNVTIPKIFVSGVIGNGSLKSGAYQFFLGYADANQVQQAGYFDITNIVPIIHDSTNSYYSNNVGCDSGLPTSKSIQLNFTNVDTQFTYLILGQIYTLNGVESYSIINYILTSQTSYLYTGSETLTTIGGGIQEILAGKQRSIYTTAKDVQDVNSYLFWGGLTGKKNPNFQPYANNIAVGWQCKRVHASNLYEGYKNPITTTNFKSLLRDEVYAIGIVLVYNDGSETCAYHIPGRPLNNISIGNPIASNQTDAWGNTYSDGWDSHKINFSDSDPNAYELISSGQFESRWKVYNTAGTYTNSIDYTSKIEGVIYNEGFCSYYEINTPYPDDTYIDSNNVVRRVYPTGNIRHHKMPDCTIAPLTTGYTPNYSGTPPYYSSRGNYNLDFNQNPYIDILGLNLANIIIPSEILNEGIIGYKIVFSKRDENNKTIESKGLLYHSRLMKSNNVTQVTFNYPFNQVSSSVANTDVNYLSYNSDSNVANNVDGSNLNLMDYISPDNLINNIKLSPSEFKVESKLEGTVTTNSVSILDAQAGGGVLPALGAVALCKYNNNLYPLSSISGALVKTQLRRSIKNAIYAPLLNGSLLSASQSNLYLDLNNRFKQSEILLGYVSSNTLSISNEYTLNPIYAITHNYTTSQVYYVALKRNLFNVYNELSSITYEYFSPGYNLYNPLINTSADGWGGDTFISLFSTRRKHTFYNNYPSDGSNIANYADSEIFDSVSGGGGYYQYNFFDGALAFWCETSVNTEYRYLDSIGSPQSDFWPHNQDISIWFNQSVVKNNGFRGYDNIFQVNIDLSKQNTDNFICTQAINSVFNKCITDYSTRVIYSETSQTESLIDNWLIEPVNNYYDFPKNKGYLTAINQLDQSKILFRFQDTCYVSAAYDVIQGSNNNIEVGTGGIFSSQPRELSYTDLGYGGSQNQLTFNSTQFGHFFIDQIRKKVYSMSGQLDEISKNKMFSFFKNNLDFKLLTYFPTFSLIDNYNNPDGLGFNSAFDSLFNIWFLSKRDYVPNPSYIGYITMVNNNFYHNGTLIHLSDTTYFTPCSFTIGYSPLYQRWISFYSFIPDEYLQTNNGIKTIKNGVVYDHFNTNVYTTYYGTTYDHIIEYIFRHNNLRGILRSIKYNSCVYQYTDTTNYFEIYNKTYYKLLIYNQNECTGYLYPKVKDEYNLSTIIDYNTNVLDSNSNIIGLTTSIIRRENIWQFSDVFDRRDKTKSVSMFSSDYTNPYYISATLLNPSLDKELNQNSIIYNRTWSQLKNLNNSWFKCRMFYNDPLTKIVNKLTITNLQESIR